jgi:hypothetical protein
VYVAGKERFRPLGIPQLEALYAQSHYKNNGL